MDNQVVFFNCKSETRKAYSAPFLYYLYISPKTLGHATSLILGKKWKMRSVDFGEFLKSEMTNTVILVEVVSLFPEANWVKATCNILFSLYVLLNIILSLYLKKF